MEVLILVLSFVILLMIGVPIAFSIGTLENSLLFRQPPKMLDHAAVLHERSNSNRVTCFPNVALRW